MFPFHNYLGQHDDPLVVSEPADFVVSQVDAGPAGQHDALTEAEAG
jgi:hypothetical protein